MTDERDVRPLRVLLVDDDPGDVIIAQEALRAGRLNTAVTVVNSGADALAHLYRADETEPADRPDLVLLDLNLPGLSGFEVLENVKAHPTLRRIPVVVLTTSSATADVLRCYDLHANAYVAKPVDFDTFTGVVRRIDEFFGAIALRPAG